jgi:hypothetical protein
LLGTYIGHNATAHRNEQTLQFVRELMKQCSIQRQNQGELLLQKRVGKEREAWILTNPTDHDVTETIAIPKGATATDLLESTTLSTDDLDALKVKSLEVRILIISRCNSPAREITDVHE